MPLRSVAVRKPLHAKRAVPRMSWARQNIFNIWQRTTKEGPRARETDFSQSGSTIFQQRWIAKTLTKGYHADFIATKVFQRWYLPDALPAIQSGTKGVSELSKWVEGREKAGGRTAVEKQIAQMEKDGRSPVASLMFAEVERRIDVCIFRACFATSVWQARRFVRQGQVKINGKVVRNANTLLSPGDIFTIAPEAIPMINASAWPAAPKADADPVEEAEAEAAAEEAGEAESESAEPATAEAAEAETSETPSSPKEETPARHAPGNFFRLPDYAQAHVFVPAYILPSYLTCSAVYVRHPTARPGYSEIPSPYDADGKLMSMAWEWYQRVAPRMTDKRRARLMDPQRSTDRK